MYLQGAIEMLLKAQNPNEFEAQIQCIWWKNVNLLLVQNLGVEN